MDSMVLLTKIVPWLLSRTPGHPNIVTMFSNKKPTLVAAIHPLFGASSSHLVKYSFVVTLVQNERLVTKRPKILVTTIFFKG